MQIKLRVPQVRLILGIPERLKATFLIRPANGDTTPNGGWESLAGSISLDDLQLMREASEVKPALTDKSLQQKIDASAKALGLKTKFMQSGAGHDSQQMATLAPVGMIFVPSVGGISHSPKEFTKTEDMAHGANVLLQSLLRVDK